MLSCSNDTSIKLWMLPPAASGSLLPELATDQSKLKEASGNELRVNSFYTINSHQDYVRAMAYSRESERLFSISDDGFLVVNDLHEQKVSQEY